MYKVYYTTSASKGWKTVHPVLIPALRETIENLAHNPRPHQSQKLTTYANAYRLRKGDYRVLYTVNDATQTLVIYKISHRKESYR
ncbi:MAG: type II toxin-antitoxin system RelE/ParE family toxin [Planctomycetota bacterium]